MTEELFQPSLKNQNYELSKSYNMAKFFLVAFYGGIIPTIVLGTKNAKWMRIDKKIITLMIFLGGVILFSKATAVGLLVEGHIEVDKSAIRWIYRIATVLIYIAYCILMRKKIKKHSVVGGDYEPILIDAIKWYVAGVIIEMIIMLIGVGIIKNVL